MVLQVDVQLSRPTVRLGGTIVGTVRCYNKSSTESVKSGHAVNGNGDKSNISSALSVRAQIESLQLSAVGLCRLDPRWHSSTAATNGSTAGMSASGLSDRNTDRHMPLLPPTIDAHATAFWTSNTLELMDLSERPYGHWKDVQPQPIQLVAREAEYEHRPEQSLSSSSSSAKPSTSLQPAADRDDSLNDDRQLAFTFRVDMPRDNMPHSVIATSCKYYYLIVLRLVTLTKANPTKHDSAVVATTEWIQLPVTVLTALAPTGTLIPSSSLLPSQQNQPLRAMAHSFGLPTHLTATELHQWEGQYTARSSNSNNSSTNNTVQSMRVDDPVTGRPVCVLSILGTAPSDLTPGSVVLLKIDFPTPFGHDASDSDWLPCASVSACLQGDEMVVATTTTMTSGKPSHRSSTRARRHVLATAHERVHADTTESVSLRLLLPSHEAACPCSLVTPHVTIAISCLIDIAIVNTKATAAKTTSKPKTPFRNLRLELPCRIQHALADWERRALQEQHESTSSISADVNSKVSALLGAVATTQDDVDGIAHMSSALFASHDIQDDLKILSLHMAVECGLAPTVQ